MADVLLFGAKMRCLYMEQKWSIWSKMVRKCDSRRVNDDVVLERYGVSLWNVRCDRHYKFIAFFVIRGLSDL